MVHAFTSAHVLVAHRRFSSKKKKRKRKRVSLPAVLYCRETDMRFKSDTGLDHSHSE